jgi:hypothetical protein
MLIYFDESYDNAHHYLLYGALFAPPTSTLHQRILQVRASTQYRPEIKYNRCKHPATLRVYQQVIDEFVADTAYFRCVVVQQCGFDYSWFGHAGEPVALKRARAYKKFAEMLLHPHVSQFENAVLLADRLTRCRGDEFLERIRDRFNLPGGKKTFRHLDEVSSALDQYQCLQVCDLLLGCVLNNLKPTIKPTKNELRQYLCSSLGVRDFLLTTWQDVSLATARDPKTKMNVWYWSAKKKPR